MVRNLNEALFNLPKLKAENHEGLRQRLESSQRHINALEGMGVATTSWDVALVYLLVKKLDSENRKWWDREDRGRELQMFKEMAAFLDRRSTCHESNVTQFQGVRSERTMKSKGPKMNQNMTGDKTQFKVKPHRRRIELWPITTSNQ